MARTFDLSERDKRRQGRADEAAEATKTLRKDLAPEAPTNVLVADLQENPYNSRVVYQPQQIDDKVQSLLQTGQATPILVAQMDDGQLVVIDGWTRTLAARGIVADESLSEDVREKFAYLEAVIRVGITPQQLATLSYVSNEEHKGLRDIDRAFAYHRALEAKVFGTQDELADAYRVDQSIVSRVVKMATAPSEIISVVQASPDKLTYSFVSEVLSSPLKVAKQRELLLETVEKNRSVMWLRSKVAALAAMGGEKGDTVQTLKLEEAAIKWSTSAKSRTVEVVLNTKADQLNLVQLLNGIFSQKPDFRAALTGLLDNAAAADKLGALLADPDQLTAVLEAQGRNK